MIIIHVIGQALLFIQKVMVSIPNLLAYFIRFLYRIGERKHNRSGYVMMVHSIKTNELFFLLIWRHTSSTVYSFALSQRCRHISSSKISWCHYKMELPRNKSFNDGLPSMLYYVYPNSHLVSQGLLKSRGEMKIWILLVRLSIFSPMSCLTSPAYRIFSSELSTCI